MVLDAPVPEPAGGCTTVVQLKKTFDEYAARSNSAIPFVSIEFPLAAIECVKIFLDMLPSAGVKHGVKIVEGRLSQSQSQSSVRLSASRSGSKGAVLHLPCCGALGAAREI
ncbi:MAG TPA: hypothetical protein VHC94_00275 [Nitrobacter sp.]|nr:hypothetical protein [Nitrobacter sp.]